MKTVSQLEVTLPHVALLLEQQRYDEALPILGDLIKDNPADREARLYRLLVVRILVLRHSLTGATPQPGKYWRQVATLMRTAVSAVHASHFHKMGGFSVEDFDPGQKMSSGDGQAAEVSALSRQVNELLIKNKELVEEINSGSSKLAESERTIEELQTIQSRLESEHQQLQLANQELQQLLANIKEQFETTQARLRDSITQAQEATERNSKLEGEIVELKQQLQASEKAIEELQSAQQRLSEIESENQQLQKEITDLRNRLQSSESGLSESAAQNHELPNRSAEPKDLAATADEPDARLVKADVPKRKWWLAMIPAAIVLAIGAGVAVGFLSMSDGEFSAPEQPPGAVEAIPDEPSSPAVADFDPPKRPSPPPLTAPAKNNFPKAVRRAKPEPPPVSAPFAEPPRLRGTFEVVLPTEVYDGPSENAALVGAIKPGMKISVVDSRNGWLEIRSKHGRPSGFVRQEAAVKVDQN